MDYELSVVSLTSQNKKYRNHLQCFSRKRAIYHSASALNGGHPPPE